MSPSAPAFYKLSGAGNDFIAFAEPPRPPRPDEIAVWCRRGLSLGADGVFWLTREGAAVRMTYHNADGERSDLCLNGCRCAARLAWHLGWAQKELRLATDVGELLARWPGENRIALELPEIVGEPRARSLAHQGERYQGWFLRVGVPHFVLPWPESLDRAPVAELGPMLRRHPDVGEDGANINFVRFTGPARCELRTYERGVEAETLACGTGVIAAVATGIAAGQLSFPTMLLTAGGFELVVSGGAEKPWVIEGDARVVARGELLAGAESVPLRPTWS